MRIELDYLDYLEEPRSSYPIDPSSINDSSIRLHTGRKEPVIMFVVTS